METVGAAGSQSLSSDSVGADRNVKKRSTARGREGRRGEGASTLPI